MSRAVNLRPGHRKPGAAAIAREGSESPTRYERRRRQTRAKLIAAAHEVMARKGVEAATIAEITSAAGVGFGSFHNHFDSKDEIARAVFSARTEHIGQISDFICDNYPQYVQAVAFIGRTYIEMADADPLWAWFVLNAQSSLQLMDDILGVRARKHLRRGVAEGHLDVTDPDLIGAIMLSSFLTLMRAIVEGRATKPAAVRTLGWVLRTLGFSDPDIRAAIKKPLPATVSRMLEAEIGVGGGGDAENSGI